MKLTVVTVLHDSAGEVAGMIASVSRLDGETEIICVDSGSTDAGPTIARDLGATVIELAGNPGYGAACNAGIAAATGDACVLLNPDARLLDDGVARLASIAAAERVILAPRLVEPDGSLQRSAHPLPGTRSALLAAGLPPRVLPAPLRDRLEPFRSPRPVAVGWAIGACLVASTDLLLELGPFDPDVFLYGEDMDLCLRAASVGVPVVFRPDVTVVHAGGRSTGPALERDRRLEMQARRRREVIRDRLGPGALELDDRSQRLTFSLRALAGRRREENLAQLRALKGAQKSPS